MSSNAAVLPNQDPIVSEPRPRRRKIMIAALVSAGALAVAIPGLGTLASFTSTDTNKNNIVKSGNVGIAFTDADGKAMQSEYVNVPNAAPAMPTSKHDITIANTGTLQQAYRVSVSNIEQKGDAPLDKVLAVKLVSDAGDTVYEGNVSSLGFTAELPIDPGSLRNYTLLIDWPDNGTGGDNEFQGSAITFDLDVNGESTGVTGDGQ